MVGPATTNSIKKINHHICHHPGYTGPATTACGPDHLYNPYTEAVVAAETRVLKGNPSYNDLIDYNENMRLVSRSLSLSLTLRLILNWQLYIVLTKILRIVPLSLGPTGALNIALITGRPLAPNPLLNLCSKLTLYLMAPPNLSLVILDNEYRFNHIFELP